MNPFVAFWDSLTKTDVKTRSDFPSWETQIASFHGLAQPWQIASPDDALTVPAIFRAVTLIANTVRMLNVEVYRNRELLIEDIPKVVTRPNPFTAPGVFYRNTAFYMATRGEAWWWIAKRDSDGIPISLFPIPPWEITVEANPRNRLEPEVKWLSKTIDNDDLRHITYVDDKSGLRGEGPLQKCGAAVSVAVEASEWAANFFSGSIPSIIGSTDFDLSPADAEALDAQWAEKPGNLPRWLGQGIQVRDFQVDASKAQMVETRRFNDGQAAVMFGIPGSLLEYSMPGSSLTYQNVEGEYTKFVRTCLQPNYLKPIEEELSDLLTRSTLVKFSTNEVTRADIKTRSEVFKNLTDSGVPGEVAGQIVGFEAIDPNPVSLTPVSQAPPSAVPSLLPPDIRAARSGGVRCAQCHKLLAETATPPYRMTCPRCKTVSEDLQVRTEYEPPPPPVINVHPAQVTVNPAPINFNRGAIQVDAPDMSSMNEAIAGLANQKPPNVRVDVAAPDMSGLAALAERPQAPTNVSITSQPDETLIEAIGELRDRIENPRVRRIERDADGRMIRLIEESA